MTSDEASATDPVIRLPAPPASLLSWPPLGALLMRPWYDRLAVKTIARWVLPLSRAWAAALESGGDADRFAAELGLDGLPGGLCGRRIRRALDKSEALLKIHGGADAHWREVFFTGAAPAATSLVAAERGRRAAAHELMAARRFFLCLRRRVDPVRWDLPHPEDMPAVAALAGDAGTCIRHPEAPAERPEVERSHSVPGPFGRQYWIRFPSPGLAGDTAWAQVFEPDGIGDPPTLISLHGIGIESEHWGPAMDSVDITPNLVRKGLRVIRPEGPWHGRRRLPGTYGGEPAMARGPLGFLQLFAAWGAEVSVIVDWARRQGSRQVAVGGVSLGALTAQLTAVAARGWPRAMQPDAAILVACTESLHDVAFGGSLAAAIGLPGRLQAKGWSVADIDRYLPLMEPRGAPVMASDKIVMVLGEADDLTPFAGGLALARRWEVPPQNLFLRRQGHFSVSIDLGRRPQPFDRLVEILKAG